MTGAGRPEGLRYVKGKPVRRERFVFAAIAVLLILVRSWVPTVLEGFYFDSDQAVVGLMAIHLSTLKHFPLYYYGLHYLMGVQAWLIAIAFWLFHPSVAVVRVPLIALNAVVAIWLIVEIGGRSRLRPALAFVAALPFIMPAPATGTLLLEAAGASIEPFVYVLLLWKMRHRPFVFGLILAFGTLHREFTLFALPALVVAAAATGRLRAALTKSTVAFLARAAAGVALVWLIIDDLKLRQEGTSIALQAVSLGGQMCGNTHDLFMRGQTMVMTALPVLYGATPVRLLTLRLYSPLVTGWILGGVMTGGALLAMAARALWLASRRSGADEVGFPVYLSTVGACAAFAYPLSCSVEVGGPPLLRYLLLALLLPVGIGAAFFQIERGPRLRAAGAAAFMLWAGMNLSDNIRVIRSATIAPPLNERRVLSDYLIANHIGYARAGYWDAYVIDFLTNERVVTASFDLVRIPDYQQQVAAHADVAVTLLRVPCDGGQRIASWCVQKP